MYLTRCNLCQQFAKVKTARRTALEEGAQVHCGALRCALRHLAFPFALLVVFPLRLTCAREELGAETPTEYRQVKRRFRNSTILQLEESLDECAPAFHYMR